MIYAKLNIHVLFEFFTSERPVAMSVDLLCPLFGEETFKYGTKNGTSTFSKLYFSEHCTFERRY